VIPAHKHRPAERRRECGYDFQPRRGGGFRSQHGCGGEQRKDSHRRLFSHVNGTARNYVACLDNAGGLDTGFDPGLGADDAVYVTALQADGKVLIGGSFTRFAGMPRPGIARLEGDAVLTTPQLVNPVHSNGVFRVSLATVNGENYFLEFKNSLTEGTWTALPAVPGNGTLMTLMDPSATGPRGFYRLRVE
jgi:Domain of unknown function (DUF5122) beta-propeller